MPILYNDYYNNKIVKKIIDWQNEVRDIEYETFIIVNQKEIKNPTDDVLKSFYEKNKKSYEIPITRDIKYLKISPSYFEDQIVINKNQLDEKYEIEKSNYKIEETREILQITTQNEIIAQEFVDLI